MVITKAKLALSLSLIFIVAILVSACGGSDSESNANGGNKPPSSGILNPGLSGKFFFADGIRGTIVSDGREFNAWIMDVATGKYTKIPDTDWENQKDLFPANWRSAFVTAAGYYEDEFIVEIPGCKKDPDRTCIIMQNMDGNYLGQFEILGDNSVSPVMSPDRQNIAIANYKTLSSSSSRRIEIYDRSGRLISRSEAAEDRISSNLSWLSDGRIVYANRRSLYFTAHDSTQTKTSLTLPNSVQGERIRQIVASPDGARLAFRVDGVPYIVNIDGTLMRKLAVLPYGGKFDNIDWSPDGRWILLREKGSRVPGGPGGAVKPHNYAIPAENLGKIFTLSEYDNERSPEVRLIRGYKVVEENIGSSAIVTNVRLADLHWLP